MLKYNLHFAALYFCTLLGVHSIFYNAISRNIKGVKVARIQLLTFILVEVNPPSNPSNECVFTGFSFDAADTSIPPTICCRLPLAGQWISLRVTFSGTTITGVVNDGAVTVSATDSAVPSGTVGVRNWRGTSRALTPLSPSMNIGIQQEQYFFQKNILTN